MSPNTAKKVTARTASRRALLQRQQELYAKENQRREREVKLAERFLRVDESRQEAMNRVSAAEVELGAVVDELIKLGSTYQTCEQLLIQTAEELRRLRGLAKAGPMHDEKETRPVGIETRTAKPLAAPAPQSAPPEVTNRSPRT